MLEVGSRVYDYSTSTIDNPTRYSAPVEISPKGFVYVKLAPLLDRGYADTWYFRIHPEAGIVWVCRNRATNSNVPRWQWTRSVLKSSGHRKLYGTHVNAARTHGERRKRARILMDHRLIVAVMNGMSIDDPRMLGKDVHHLNHDPHDNRFSNLKLMSRLEHQMLHRGSGASTEHPAPLFNATHPRSRTGIAASAAVHTEEISNG